MQIVRHHMNLFVQLPNFICINSPKLPFSQVSGCQLPDLSDHLSQRSCNQAGNKPAHSNGHDNCQQGYPNHNPVIIDSNFFTLLLFLGRNLRIMLHKFIQ
ncbi:hypothetical protein SDC9_174497 [bioreactor metagenome]|uniref:Uncharacterized protein n=1 Tax=bioreactor metagenome TaxID=1076179 RepID=A0A645GLM7_9ZZZZ